MKRLNTAAAPYLLVMPYTLHFLLIVALPVVFSLILTVHR